MADAESKSSVAGLGFAERVLSEAEVRAVLAEAFAPLEWTGKRVLVLIPDGTRSGPVDLFFRLYHERLWGRVKNLDYLIALGTHPPMSEAQIHKRLGVTAKEMAARYAGVRVFNHAWEKPETFRTAGLIPAPEIEAFSGGRLSRAAPVRLNKMLFEYDRIIVCGPVFPHEVAGFSGGNKYFFPGVSGPELIHLTHWLAALISNVETIGRKRTPVREIINRAASFLDVPKLLCCFVVRDEALAGLYVGGEEAWSRAADLSAKVHVKYVERPYRQVLALIPEMYDDLWTAAKGMYKLEPVVADGGEVILYAPHLSEFSYTHGKVIDEIGFHVRDYFVKQWARFERYPWGVLAHSTHVRGAGTFEDGVEHPRVRVTLASRVTPERCARVGLGYRDPETIQPAAFEGREDEGILVVPHAGETLYRLKE